ncbi:MAG TPA: 50S ribosomal protein L25 [Longimicrobiales bacterium]|nr:50S ribosomal protein L25 [Longimicrobiales bacterium]
MKSLNATKRDGAGKGVARKLRQGGRVPAVMYGKDMDPVHLSIDAMEAVHLFHAISTDNTIVDLVVEGEKEPFPTLVREIQAHPHKHELVHVDFLRVQMGVAVEVEVPVELLGTPVGVKLHGGVLEHLVHEVPVKCIPSLIPESIQVDVSGLEIDDAVHLNELTFPEGVELLIDDDRTVCIVAAPRAVVEEEAEEGEEGVGAAEPEVIGQDEGEDEG